MKIRELLQTEIWSKRTSRRILVGIGILAVGFLCWCAIEQYVLTPGERSAARAALVQVDELQDFATPSDEDFNARTKQAEEKVELAKRAASTARDKNVAVDLEAYLGLTSIDREEMRRQKSMQQADSPLVRRDQEFELKMETAGKKARLIVRLELHRALD